MAFSFITTADLKAKVAAFLQQPSPASLSPNWDQVIQDAIDAAYRDIQGALAERGYTVSQINTWEDGASVQRTQALYYALIFGAGLHNMEPWVIDRLDQRKSLETAPVNSASSDPIGPAGSPGIIQVGLLDTTNDRWNDKTQL